MQKWIYVLTALGNIIGGIVVIYGIVLSISMNHISPLLVSLAIIIVGPIEDILNAWVPHWTKKRQQEKLWQKLIDRSTSIMFLILLGISLYYLAS